MAINAQPALDLTVIVPAFNRASMIARTLNSIRAQDSQPKEIIVVDDASQDTTLDVVQQWSKETDYPVKIIPLSTNSGPANARNIGIKEATTRYVSIIDSDDEYTAHALRTLISPLETISNCVLSFADAHKVINGIVQEYGFFRGKIDRSSGSFHFDEFGEGLHRLKNPIDVLLEGSMIPTSSTCFRRDDAIAVGGMPTQFRSGEDWLFWLLLSQRGQFVFRFERLSIVHRHGENLTHLRSAEFVAREKLRGLISLQRGDFPVLLDESHKKTLVALHSKQYENWTYHLSRLGLRAYLSGLWHNNLSRGGSVAVRLATKPKNLVRALYCSLLGLFRNV